MSGQPIENAVFLGGDLAAILRCRRKFPVFRHGVPFMIGNGVPSFLFNEINGWRGHDHADEGHFSISIFSYGGNDMRMAVFRPRH